MPTPSRVGYLNTDGPTQYPRVSSIYPRPNHRSAYFILLSSHHLHITFRISSSGCLLSSLTSVYPSSIQIPTSPPSTASPLHPTLSHIPSSTQTPPHLQRPASPLHPTLLPSLPSPPFPSFHPPILYSYILTPTHLIAPLIPHRCLHGKF